MEYILNLFKILVLFIYSLFPSSAEVNDIELQEGFKINIFAEGLNAPRFMALSNDGVVFASLIRSGNVVALPDNDNNGKADKIIIKSSNLKRPNSIAFYKQWLYVAESHQIIRYKYNGYDKLLGFKEIVIKNLPAGGHYTKTIIFGKDNKLYVSIGSSCNVCIEKDKTRATIMQFNPDGTNGKIYAEGLRNSIGLTIHPETGDIWASNNGRDWMGDDLPHEEINIIRQGKHYGWPYCYDDRIVDPEFGNSEFCKKTELPVFKMQAHSAPMGLVFYNGKQFPSEYHDDLFVAFHGSWNRSVPTGYKVVRIRMNDNKPESIEDFTSGWLMGTKRTGRPVGLLLGKDGSLFVSDDYNGKIYRIYYDS